MILMKHIKVKVQHLTSKLKVHRKIRGSPKSFGTENQDSELQGQNGCPFC